MGTLLNNAVLGDGAVDLATPDLSLEGELGVHPRRLAKHRPTSSAGSHVHRTDWQALLLSEAARD